MTRRLPDEALHGDEALRDGIGRQEQILAQGTDWRFLNELKKELKG